MGITIISEIKLRCDVFSIDSCSMRTYTFQGGNVKAAKQKAKNKGWILKPYKCICPDCAKQTK